MTKMITETLTSGMSTPTKSESPVVMVGAKWCVGLNYTVIAPNNHLSDPTSATVEAICAHRVAPTETPNAGEIRVLAPGGNIAWSNAVRFSRINLD